MRPLNRTAMARKHAGKWLALKPDRQTVVASGTTAEQVLAGAAQGRRAPRPHADAQGGPALRGSAPPAGMKFPYARLGSTIMPIIPVTLRREELLVVTEALVDSGAASSIFDAQFAAILGIHDLEENGREILFEGVSGHQLIGYSHEVTIEVGGHAFAPMPIAFSRGEMPDNAVNILEQQGFFDLFPIKFTYGKREIDFMIGGRR